MNNDQAITRSCRRLAWNALVLTLFNALFPIVAAVAHYGSHFKAAMRQQLLHFTAGTAFVDCILVEAIVQV